ncbi:MAG: carbohydrate kinase [Puniceicoccaceae bacterium]|nr:MAG: carbohydrate kinase [Puniceicoccaceae bacterium]
MPPDDRKSSAKPLIVGIGEVLWDRFPDGDRLGGAPANFAHHANQLGADGRILSRVGLDDDGDNLIAELAGRNYPNGYFQRDPDHPTGVVRVTLDDGQPSYEIVESVAWDFLEWSEPLEELALQARAVCFGTLAQRHAVSRQTIQRFVSSTAEGCLRIFDVNLRQRFYNRETLAFGLEHATVLKVNEDELAEIALLFDWGGDAAAWIPRALQDFGLSVVVQTLGSRGCRVATREETFTADSDPVEVVDAVGAGDAFTAAFAVGLVLERPLQEVAARANLVGGFVAGVQGAMPVLPERLRYPARD